MLYGGVGYATQRLALKSGVDVVVGTPGRILDLVGQGKVSLSRIEYLVLDEADEMLDAGFAPSVEKLLGLTYEPQTVLASATMPTWVSNMAEKHTHDAGAGPAEDRRRPDRSSTACCASRASTSCRRSAGCSTVTAARAIIFGRTKHGVKKLNHNLRQLGHNTVELQGDLSQAIRDRAMASFREGRSQILVATNVAARGIDVNHVGLVVNFELPDSAQWLTHRVGRTARMGEAGRALTFVTPEDEVAWVKLSRQGAPDIRELDTKRLLDEGAWHYRERSTRPAQVRTVHRSRATVNHSRRRRWPARDATIVEVALSRP